jgi:hypothetical protein
VQIVPLNCPPSLAQVPALPPVASPRNGPAGMTWASSSAWRVLVRSVALLFPNCRRESGPALVNVPAQASFLRTRVEIVRASLAASGPASFLQRPCDRRTGPTGEIGQTIAVRPGMIE